MLKKNICKTKPKIKLNNVPSNYRNYISEPFLSYSKTMMSTSFLDSHLNLSLNNNTTNNDFFSTEKKNIKTIIEKNKSLDRLKVMRNHDDLKNDLKQFNIKFNTFNIDKRKKEHNLTYNKDKNKNKINTIKIKNNNHNYIFKRTSSFSRFNNNINRRICKNNYIIKTIISNIKNKNESLKIRLNTMINDFKENMYQIREKSNKIRDLKQYKLFNKFKENINENYNIINIKERDIKKFNDFAISKLMDINDIKNQNNNFFDYNYNRNYIKKTQKDFSNNYNLIKIIPKNIKYNRKEGKRYKIIEELFQS